MECIICTNTSKLLCNICWSKINFLTRNSNDIQAVVEYNDIIRELIHIFKYKSPSLLIDLFVNWMILFFEDLICEVDYIIPVPMHKYKLMQRGYNQAACIAKALNKKYKKSCIFNVLLKIKNTQSQSSLNQQERLINLHNAFQINLKQEHILYNKKVLLIDDVITTGSTLLECKKVLKMALSVKSLCIAMTKYEYNI